MKAIILIVLTNFVAFSKDIVAPIVKFECSVSETVLHCDASDSYDQDGKIVKYTLEADGNKVTSSSPKLNVEMRFGGKKNIKLSAEDNSGNIGIQNMSFDSTELYPLKANPLCFRLEKQVNCRGIIKDESLQVKYQWIVNGEKLSTLPVFSFENKDIHYDIVLEVEDKLGRKDRKSFVLEVPLKPERPEKSKIELFVFFEPGKKSYSLEDEYVKIKISDVQKVKKERFRINLNGEEYQNDSLKFENDLMLVKTSYFKDGLNIFYVSGRDVSNLIISQPFELVLGTSRLLITNQDDATYDLYFLSDQPNDKRECQDGCDNIAIKLKDRKYFEELTLPSGPYVIVKKSKNTITAQVIHLKPKHVNEVSIPDEKIRMLEGNLYFEKQLEQWSVLESWFEITQRRVESGLTDVTLRCNFNDEGKARLSKYFTNGRDSNYFSKIDIEFDCVSSGKPGLYYHLVKNLTKGEYSLFAGKYITYEYQSRTEFSSFSTPRLDINNQDIIGLDYYFELIPDAK